MEFKVFDAGEEGMLADTVRRARAQIADRDYVAGLETLGIAKGRILTYGIAFCDKEVLVG